MLLVGLVLTMSCSTSVLAHAVLVEASPADGMRLETAPTEIVLRFNEPVVPVVVRLLDGQGTELADVAVQPAGEAITMRPARELPQGVYFLSYRVASLDAHPVAGTLHFGIGVDAGFPNDQSITTAPQGWLTAFGRWLVYLTALGAIGATMFELLVRPPPPLEARTRRLTVRLATWGLAALALRLGTAGLELGGLPISSLASPTPWAIAAATTLGPAIGLAALGLAALAAGGRLPAVWRLLAVAAIVGSFALTGHAASAEPRWLTVPAVGLHVLCAAFWLGSLLPLLWSLDLERPRAAMVIGRFSTVALAAVALLAGAGTALAWVQLGGSLGALTTTAYGWRLIGKLALVAALLVVATLNRLWLTPALARGAWRADRGLRWSLRADLALGLAILAVTATFPLGPPPRVLTALDTGALTVVIAAPAGQATLTLLPGRTGTNRLEAWVTDRDGGPVQAREASLSWSLPDAGIERSRAAMELPAPGVATATGLVLPRGGRWKLQLDLLIDDFTKLTFVGGIDVP
ncbi:MAG: CopD family protein [Geminicoccaceae bacterium]